MKRDWINKVERVTRSWNELQKNFAKRQLETAFVEEESSLGAISSLFDDDDKVELRNKIYNTNLTELVETIKEERNILFRDFSEREKTDLQNKLVYFCISYIGETHKYFSDVIGTVKNFLVQENVKVRDLSEQDVHRIIMLLASNAYAQCNNREAKKILSLIENMVLIK
ncbi:MAG: hypothetical protein LBK92_04765 [Endomicrobium sp.]|jgi:hypothetical protein|nr:hypothetical protein [Endomicrobium sp.]